MMRQTVCIRSQADEAQILRCRHFLSEMEGELQLLARNFALLGAEPRLKMVAVLLREGELCPCDLADMLRLSVSAVSQHLRKLRDGGIVQTRREGQTIFYALTPTARLWLDALFASSKLVDEGIQE